MQKRTKFILTAVFIFVFSFVLIFFWPSKMASRVELDMNDNILITGHARYYIEPDDRNFDFYIDDASAIEKIADLLGSLRGFRTFKNVETPLLYGDHRYVFTIFDKTTGEMTYFNINGRYIEADNGARYIKYRIFPKDIPLSIIDRMVTPFIEEGFNDPLVPIEFTDETGTLDMNSDVKDGWVHVQWIDGHTGDEQYATVKGVSPYTKLEIFADGNALVIFYDEGEGEKTDIELRLASLPVHPMDSNAKIVFILNGERSFNTRYTFGRE